MIEGSILIEILKDIEKCNIEQDNNIGSCKLAKVLKSKYSVVFSDFQKTISTEEKKSKDEVVTDCREELKNIKGYLEGYLIRNTTDLKTRLKIKIINDIAKIDKSNIMPEAELMDLYVSITNYYQGKIKSFGKNLYGYDFDNDYFDNSDLPKHSILTNFKAIKAKLEAFFDADCKNELQNEKESFINATFSNQNTNLMNLNLSFETVYSDAQKEINDNTTFSDEEIEEIIGKLSELEKTVNSNQTKREKWANAKPLFLFALDKGIDIALAFLPVLNFLK